jgi:Transposase, Mutator family
VSREVVVELWVSGLAARPPRVWRRRATDPQRWLPWCSWVGLGCERNSDWETTTVTDDMIALRELLEKGSDATLLREMIGFAAQPLMELETEALCGAAHGERSENRINMCNGCRDRDWHTRAGTVELRIPKLREGSYSLSFWSRGGRPRRR